MNLDLALQELQSAIGALPKPWLRELATSRLHGLTLQQARFRHSVSWHSIYGACAALPAFSELLTRIDQYEAARLQAVIHAAALNPPPQSTAQK